MESMHIKTTKKSAPATKKTLDNSLPDLSQHPIVLKKAAEAREFLKKHPIPEYLLRR